MGTASRHATNRTCGTCGDRIYGSATQMAEHSRACRQALQIRERMRSIGLTVPQTTIEGAEVTAALRQQRAAHLGREQLKGGDRRRQKPSWS